MNYQDTINELEEINKNLLEEIKKLNEELCSIKEHLKKYTSPLNNKIYYETHKEEHKQRVKEYQKNNNYKSNYKPTPEQKKEYNRREYLKRKEKQIKEV